MADQKLRKKHKDVSGKRNKTTVDKPKKNQPMLKLKVKSMKNGMITVFNSILLIEAEEIDFGKDCSYNYKEPDSCTWCESGWIRRTEWYVFCPKCGRKVERKTHKRR